MVDKTLSLLIHKVFKGHSNDFFLLLNIQMIFFFVTQKAKDPIEMKAKLSPLLNRRVISSLVIVHH